MVYKPNSKNLNKGHNAVFLSPHSDDIALSLGASLLSKSIALHGHLITVFSISKNTANDSFEDTAVVSAIRKAEDNCFAKSIYQNMSVAWLDRKDAPVRLNISDGAIFNSILSSIDLYEVRYVVDKVKAEYDSPDLVLAPMALGNHIDHIVVRNAALELVEHGFPIVFYEDLPYAANASLTEIDEYAEQLGALSCQKLELFSIETGVSIENKIALLSCYRSQMDSRTENRVRSHTDKLSGNSVIERLWASENALTEIQYVFKVDRS